MAIGYKEQTALSVPTPASGEQYTFLDSVDHKLKRKLSDGTIVDIEAGGGGSGGGGLSNFETVMLTADDLTAGYITLASAPASPLAITLTVSGGIPQIPGVDFVVVGSQVQFEGYGLGNGFLEIGDILLVQY